MSDLDELRALLAAATPGPWASQATEQPGDPNALIYGPDGDSFAFLSWNPGNDYDMVATAALIVWLRNHAEALLGDSLDAARLARAIHRTGIANCRNECGPVDAPYSGADADMAVFLAREYASGSPEGKTP